MADEEDILLREVDEELKQDQTVAFFKKNGPVLVGAAALVVAAVAGLQFKKGADARAEAARSEAYQTAVDASLDDQTAAPQTMLAVAGESTGGYAGLARLRAAAFLAGEGNVDDAIAALDEVAKDGSLPTRMRDLARLKMAQLLVDTDPARAKSVAGEVSSEPMMPLADEVIALADFSAGDYEAAYQGLSRLSTADPSTTSPATIQRARFLAPVADAARRGVSMELPTDEASEFIQSFSDRLSEELSAPAEEEGAEVETPAGDDNL